MSVPKKYAWLLNEPGPMMLKEALRHYGVLEYMNGSNPYIMKWAKEAGVRGWYNDDSVPWCGLFVGIVAKRCGYDFPAAKLLSSMAWQGWGIPVPLDGAKLGYIVIFTRGKKLSMLGHVGICVGEDKDCIHVLGGNQMNMVNISRIEKSRLVAVRKPAYKIAEPYNVRKIYLKPTGEISKNEQ